MVCPKWFPSACTASVQAIFFENRSNGGGEKKNDGNEEQDKMNKVWLESCIRYGAFVLPFFSLVLARWETNEGENCPPWKKDSLSVFTRFSKNAINSSGLTLETNFIYIYKRTHFHLLNLVGRVWCSFFSGKTKLKYFPSMIGIYHNVAAADTNVIERKKSWNLPGKLWKGQ